MWDYLNSCNVRLFKFMQGEIIQIHAKWDYLTSGKVRLFKFVQGEII